MHHINCDTLVVRAVVAGNGLKHMLVDNGSLVNLLFVFTFDKIQIKHGLIPMIDPLNGFTGDSIILRGRLTLAVEMETTPLVAHHLMEFLVVDLPTMVY